MSQQKKYSNATAVDILHQVSSIYSSTRTPYDYGTGEEYTSAEVHLLKYIREHEGITVTELARDFCKTKGAISQMLKKLEARGLIVRQVDLENNNRFHLSLTQKGIALDDAHREFDEIGFGESMNVVRELFSEAEIAKTFEVLEKWLEVRRQVQVHRLQKKKEQVRMQKRTNK